MTKLFLVPALLGASFAVAAQANDRIETVRVTVMHADLDLSNSAAERRLRNRVRAAAQNVCATPRLDLRAAQKAAECRRFALAQAETQIRLAVAQARLDKARFAAARKDPAA